MKVDCDMSKVKCQSPYLYMMKGKTTVNGISNFISYDSKCSDSNFKLEFVDKSYVTSEVNTDNKIQL